jgi:hypothetical protein
LAPGDSQVAVILAEKDGQVSAFMISTIVNLCIDVLAVLLAFVLNFENYE